MFIRHLYKDTKLIGTIAFERISDTEFRFGLSVVAKVDNPSKKIGKQIAVNRLFSSTEKFTEDMYDKSTWPYQNVCHRKSGKISEDELVALFYKFKRPGCTTNKYVFDMSIRELERI